MKTERIALRVPPDLREQFREACSEIHVTESDLLRCLMRDFLTRHAKRDRSQSCLRL